MKLPIASLFEKKEKNNYFLAALLRDDLIKVIIFEDIDNKIKVLGAHSEHFPTTLEKASIEEWIDTFDKAVGMAEQALPQGSELKKTVFGVKQDWVEEAKIKKDYLQKLKKVSEELDLQPIGFLVFSEAIIHLLQKEQGAPVSGILVELGKNNIITSIIRAGKIIETKDSPITASPVEAVEQSLKGVVNMEILPSKILLFDGDHSESLTQEFISHPWNKHLPFLHVPQVTVLSDDFDAKAVIYGTALQLGMEILDDNLAPPKTTSSVNSPGKEEIQLESPQIDTPKTEAKEDLPVIKQGKKVEEEPEEKTLYPADHFGFSLDKDIVATPSPTIQPPVAVSTPEEEDEEENTDEKHHGLKLPFQGLFAKKNDTMIPEPVINEPKISKGKPKLIVFLLPLMLLIIICGLIFYIMKVKTTVILTIAPKIINANQDITFSTKDDNNFSNDIIHASTVTVTEDGSVSADATGKKDIGNPAKGTVTIFNSSGTTVKVAAGTTISASTGQKFSTDKDVTVASASGDIFSGTKPGTTDITLTATGIGPDYNLPSGTKFSIGDNASVAAKNNDAFSGGTKKQATVVAKTDIDKLITQLEHNLESKAKDDITKQTSADKGVLSALLKESIQKQKTDKNVNDETKTVTLTGTVEYIGMTYAKNDLTSYAKTLLKNKVSDPSQLSTDAISASLDNAAAKDDTKATASVKATAALTPNIDTKKITHDIVGKSLDQTKTILSHVSQVTDTTITFSPNIFFMPHMLPLFEKHIQVIIRTK